MDKTATSNPPNKSGGGIFGIVDLDFSIFYTHSSAAFYPPLFWVYFAWDNTFQEQSH